MKPNIIKDANDYKGVYRNLLRGERGEVVGVRGN